MTDPAIIESGMTFGPYPKGQSFYIEKSAAYQAIQQGVKIAEFLLLRAQNKQPSKVLIVEAKPSSPNPKNDECFDQFIADIHEKLSNTLSLGLALCLGRHGQASTELPAPFETLNLATADFRFVLVINGHPKAWLPPLQEALSKALHATVKTWGLSPCAVLVLNDDGARKYGLILNDAHV
jgi:hypothetical protein